MDYVPLFPGEKKAAEGGGTGGSAVKRSLLEPNEKLMVDMCKTLGVRANVELFNSQRLTAQGPPSPSCKVQYMCLERQQAADEQVAQLGQPAGLAPSMGTEGGLEDFVASVADIVASVAPAGLFDLPEGVLDAIFGCLGLGDLATACCASLSFHAHCQACGRALGLKLELCAADDLRLLPRQHNALLLGAGAICSPGGYGSACSTGPTSSSGGISKGDPGSSSSAGSGAYDRQRQRVLGYVPAALHYASQRCRALQRLHLELPPPPVPLSAASEAVSRAVAGEPWGLAWAPAWPAAAAGAPPGGAAGSLADSECPPVDGYLLKLLAQCCPGLLSVRLVNLTNNATLNRLARPNDGCLALLGRSCPKLQELVIGHRGGEECMFNPAAPFYLEEVTDAGLRALAQHCTQLRCLGLLRCSRVGDDGLAAVAQLCRQLTALTLHDCPGISELGLMKVGKRCTQLRLLDCTVARRAGGLLLMGEEPEQLGFRALFTIAANCPHLEELSISEEGLEAPVVDDDCIICLAQGCPRLRRLALRHCAAVTDAAVRAVAARCKQMQELVLEHTAVGDGGVLHAARGLPLLRVLSISNYASSLGHLAGLPGGGASDAALGHVAQHCHSLRHLAISGSRHVTDAGLRHLAARLNLAATLTALSIDHTAALDGSVGQLLALCTQLRALSLRGLLFNADATVELAASSCRHLTSLDLRHCSTLSDTGLAHVARLPMLRRLHLAFCVRLTDAGLCLLARVAPASAAFAVGRAGCGHAGSGACAVGNFGGTSVGEEPPAWPVSGCGAPGGAPDLDGHGRVAGGDEHTSSGGGVGVCGGTGARRPPPLEEVELYQVHQVTHRGVWALAAACPQLAHVNIGKCRLVRPEALRGLLVTRPLRLSVCHYLDS
ncbi:hypothetical protein ABPG77_006431 [Micractinium sp. CCAP 211/92]